MSIQSVSCFIPPSGFLLPGTLLQTSRLRYSTHALLRRSPVFPVHRSRHGRVAVAQRMQRDMEEDYRDTETTTTTTTTTVTLTTTTTTTTTKSLAKLKAAQQQQEQQQQLQESKVSAAEEKKAGERTKMPKMMGFSYGSFAKSFPFANNIMIATLKTAAADLLAQCVISQTPLDAIDWQRNLLFCAFGAIYLGGFQYLYQVQIFKRLFNIDKFTSQSWPEKLRDGPGLRALLAQTALDLSVLTAVYLPTFYVFKASVFSGTVDPALWFNIGIANYTQNFAKDELDLLLVWLPADLVCFSVPLYLRLPVRHIVSFVWTAYLSFARGGH